MARVLVTGATGLLGQVLCHDLADDHDVVALTHSRSLLDDRLTGVRADIRDEDALSRLWEAARPEYVVHTAALASVDECERDPDRARAENADAVGTIARLCRRHGSRLVHVSTDAVFDGSSGPYTEDDPVGPLNVYARTKWEGEDICLREAPDALVARVNFFGWSATGTRSLAEFFYNAVAEGRPVNGFTDVQFSPLYSRDLGDLLWAAAQRRDVVGVRHVAARDALSKHEFGREVARTFGFNTDLVRPCTAAETHSVVRSPRLILDASRIAGELGRPLPTVRDGLRRLHEDARSGYRDQLRAAVDNGGPPAAAPSAGKHVHNTARGA